MVKVSRRCCNKPVQYAPMPMPTQGGNCICNFPTLIILILIVLQFSRQNKKRYDDDGEYGDRHGNVVDNGILFIIALFYLSCAGCGKGCGSY